MAHPTRLKKNIPLPTSDTGSVCAGPAGPRGCPGPRGPEGPPGPQTPLSDAVDSEASGTGASSLAVKTAYDLAGTAFDEARRKRDYLDETLESHVTIHVDAVHGNDAADGLSQAHALRSWDGLRARLRSLDLGNIHRLTIRLGAGDYAAGVGGATRLSGGDFPQGLPVSFYIVGAGREATRISHASDERSLRLYGFPNSQFQHIGFPKGVQVCRNSWGHFLNCGFGSPEHSTTAGLILADNSSTIYLSGATVISGTCDHVYDVEQGGILQLTGHVTYEACRVLSCTARARYNSSINVLSAYTFDGVIHTEGASSLWADVHLLGGGAYAIHTADEQLAAYTTHMPSLPYVTSRGMVGAQNTPQTRVVFAGRNGVVSSAASFGYIAVTRTGPGSYTLLSPKSYGLMDVNVYDQGAAQTPIDQIVISNVYTTDERLGRSYDIRTFYNGQPVDPGRVVVTGY